MKILTQNYNINIPIRSTKSFSQNWQNISAQNFKNDSFEISFKGDDDNKIKELYSIDLSKAKDISGISCPSCGVKMLSNQEFENIIQIAEEIKTGEDFLKLLNQYKNYIPENMQTILNTKTEFIERPRFFKNKTEEEIEQSKQFYKSNSMYRFFSNAKYDAYKIHKTNVYFAKQYLTDFAQTLDEDNKTKLLEIVTDINSVDSNYKIGQKVKPFLNKLDITQEKRTQVHDAIFPKLYNSGINLVIFKHNIDYKNLSPTEISVELVKRIFQNSLMEIKPISNYEKTKHNPHNQVLVCKKCDSHASNMSFLDKYYYINPNLKDNMKAYISNISYLMGKGLIDKNKNYLKNFLYIASKATYNEIKFEESYETSLHRLIHAAQRHEDFEPIIQTKIDIPCASCDTILMPHSIRTEMLKELGKCEKLPEFAQILNKYDKYISEHSRDLANVFINIAHNKPDISEQDFLDSIHKQMKPFYERELEQILDNLRQARLYFLDTDNKNRFDITDNVLEILEDYIDSGKFKNFNFADLYFNCFKNYNLDNSPNAVYTTLTTLRMLSYKADLSKTTDRDKQYDKNAFYTIAFNIMKPSVATVDHLVAICKSGEKDKNNCIALCKPCNTILKSKKEIASWYSQVIGIRKNMHKQLLTIDKMAKDGLITGFDNWAKNIADQMYKNSFQRYDLRHLFYDVETLE